MKQGNPTKRFGLVALISAMISGLTSTDLVQRKNNVLINGGCAPIPSKFPNQRQKRKLAEQMRG